MTAQFDRVEVKGLVKVYGATRALVGVSARFDAEAVTVIEGPNGSGKSTLLNILGQLVKPTRGEVRYGEHEGKSSIALRAAIGILAHAMIYPDLSSAENLRLFARLHGLPSTAEHVAALFDRFEIGRWGERPARTYSRGQLQRLALARAVAHAPQLILLDEPSTGLDVRAVERLERTVNEEKARGAIVVLITHDAGLADRLAERRVVLERGRVKEAA